MEFSGWIGIRSPQHRLDGIAMKEPRAWGAIRCKGHSLGPGERSYQIGVIRGLPTSKMDCVFSSVISSGKA